MKIKKYLWIIAAVVIIVIIDQTIKFGFVQYWGNTDITVINNALNITYVENQGMAFGIGLGSRITIILMNVTVITLIIYFIISRKEQLDMTILTSLSLILAGGIANLIDRIFRGYVIDYINVLPQTSFPVFNISDICIDAGAILLGITIVMYWIRKK